MEKSDQPYTFALLKKEKYGSEESLDYIDFQAKTRASRVGKKIKEMRVNLNMTQQQLADRLGKNKSYISKIEKGSDMNLSTMFKLFDHGLQIPIKFVVGDIVE